MSKQSIKDLSKIGFYTLDNNRAKNSSINSPMWRTEIIITEACNFKCPYCRGLSNEIYGTRQKKMLSLAEVKHVIDLWSVNGLNNIRFSGGEPTTHPDLVKMVAYAKSKKVKRIAISTNGSADISLYNKLVNAGANDFSVSLDGCCSQDIDKMAGVNNQFEKIKNAIQFLSSKTYTTVGCVFTPNNIGQLIKTITFADSLGVSDIRIISAAQWNEPIKGFKAIPKQFLDKFPILKYRVENFIEGRNVRGMKETDAKKCSLIIDDSVVAGDYHFPCVIYMREKGKPIGKVGLTMREDRIAWLESHDCFKDPICKKNCLDVCIDYNNVAKKLKNSK